MDDLLDGERPVRALSRADWQSLLSFAFALGGGVLFYLLDLFMPMALCYCAYLGCMAYGVYLQKYYAYHSRWFRIANALMCLAVNLTFVTAVLTAAAALIWFGSSQAMLGASVQTLLLCGNGGWVLLAALAVLACAFLLTAAIQTAICRWNGGSPFHWGEMGAAQVRLKLVRPALRRLLPGLVPWLAAAFWLLSGRFLPPGEVHGGQLETFFLVWLVLLAVLGSLPLLGRGHRRWIPAVWCMAALCWGMTGLRVYRWAWSPVTESLVPYSSDLGSIYVPLGQASWAMAAAAAALCALWVLLQCVRLGPPRAGTPEPGEED